MFKRIGLFFKEAYVRWNTKGSPIFFRWLGNAALTLAGMAATLTDTFNEIIVSMGGAAIPVPPLLRLIAGYVVTAGLVAKGVAKLTTYFTPKVITKEVEDLKKPE